MDTRALKKTCEKIEGLRRKLQAAAARLNLILHADVIFDPSDPVTAQAKHSRSAIPDFCGAGVYAIYHRCDHEHHRPFAGMDDRTYLCKADPAHPSGKDAVAEGAEIVRQAIGSRQEHRGKR